MTKSADAFKTISEVADELNLPQHVLRFWETRFKQLKPMKRGGGRRYYRPEDVLLLQGIRHLLYSQGYTIKGVQRILKEQGPRAVMNAPQHGLPVQADDQQTAVPVEQMTAGLAASRKQAGAQPSTDRLRAALSELLECKRLLDQAR